MTDLADRPEIAESPTPPARLTPFDMLYDALTQKFPGLTGDSDGVSVFQFTASPIAASWVTGTDSDAYDIANSVPINLGGFYDKGDALDTAYQTLILSVKPANYSDNPAYTAAQTTLGGLTNSMTQTVANANSAYQVWASQNTDDKGLPAETKTAWLLDPLGGHVWQAKLTQIQAQIDRQSAKLSAIVKSMDAALSAAQDAATTDTMAISVAGGTAIQVPSVSIDGDLGGDLARWASYPAGQYDLQAVMDGNYTITSPWTTLYTTTVHQDCYSTNTTVSVDTSRIIEDVSFQLKADVVGIATYTINRGRWYNPVYVTPSVAIAPGSTVSSDNFFGVDGTLHLIPETLFVMYRPTYTLTISKECYQQQFVAQSSADVDWIDLFGSRFAFDGLASLNPITADDTVTLTFASPDGAVPQIMGVTSKAEWNKSTNPSVSTESAEPALASVDPRPMDVPGAAAVTGVPPQGVANFPALDQGTVVEVARYQLLGGAPFVVYNSVTRATLGAGECPALSARPPYKPVWVPAGVPWTVQNLSPTVSIVVSY